MASNEDLNSTDSIAQNSLAQRLAKVLPKGLAFRIYHVSTPPTRVEALYSAPPGERADRTYCERHFLTISINPSSKQNSAEANGDVEVLVFAIEVLIYSTAYSTTIFVSKADSSGYLYLLNIPRGTYSPVKEVSATFLSYLLGKRRRPYVRTIVSLFARAQDQYLFPRSIHNSGKHVLDDRGLVKWWCRVLDRLVVPQEPQDDGNNAQIADSQRWKTIRGYLTVPGLDKFETSSYLPLKKATSVWAVGHPLYEISRYPRATIPPRSLVPHFPDDPKARFLDELNDEMSKSQAKASGEWKTVKSLEMFWEMMAFRQECSAGRMVGFFWVVFTPDLTQEEDVFDVPPASQASVITDMTEETDLRPATPNTSFLTSTGMLSPAKSRDKMSIESTARRKKQLTGPVVARPPKVKTQKSTYMRSLERPESTAYYVWPADSRGQIVVDERDYDRMHELLLYLDFADLNLSLESTKRWVNEVRDGAPGDTSQWGTKVVGMRLVEAKSETGEKTVNTLNMGLVRKKRKVEDIKNDDDDKSKRVNGSAGQNAPVVNVLGAEMVRKKPKTA